MTGAKRNLGWGVGVSIVYFGCWKLRLVLTRLKTYLMLHACYFKDFMLDKWKCAFICDNYLSPNPTWEHDVKVVAIHIIITYKLCKFAGC